MRANEAFIIREKASCGAGGAVEQARRKARTMMSRLELRLLGGFQARVSDGPVVDIAAKKTQALLAYLALAKGKPQSRDKILGLLWSDRAQEQARNSLRQALTEVGRAIAVMERSPILKDHDMLAVEPGTVWVDALEFERLAATGDGGDLQRAAALYEGDLLDGIAVRDAAFEEWLLVERQRLRSHAMAALKALLGHVAGPAAAAAAHRLLALDPLQEAGHRALIRLHADAGEVGAALRQYETCRDLLQRELDVAPSAETDRLYREIRNRTTTAGGHGAPEGVSGSAPRQAAEAPPSKPSIAVLPFTNMNGDPAERYFSDGVTEDIITELSRFRSLFVIARNSSFQYRDKAVDVRRVGQELGVQYVVEGSVRKTGDRLRISAQLIEATTGNHLWSERYDRELADIFAVQDDVVQAIAASLAGQLVAAGQEKARRKRTEHLGAYDCYLRGLDYWRYNSSEADAESKKWFEKALGLDPDYGEPLARLSISASSSASHRDSADRFEPSLTMANRAVALDPNNSWSHCALGFAKLMSGSVAAAADHFASAMRLNPNDPDQLMFFAAYQVYAGKLEAAQESIAAAQRLNPLPPVWYRTMRGMLAYGLHRYAAAAQLFEDPESSTDFWHRYCLAACYERLGRRHEAKSEIARALKLRPNLSVGIVTATEPYARPDDLEHLLEPLRKAGLPE